MRVLLVTDRAFLPPTDGSTQIYDAWLRALTGLGAAVSVLSFDHGRERWAEAGIAEAARRGAAIRVVPFARTLAEAASRRAVEHVHQLATGRRHLPAALGRPWAARGRQQLAGALAAERWDAIVVQKLDTAAMVGFDALRRAGRRLVLDLHDNLPARQSLTRATVRRAARQRTWPLLRALRPEEVADAILPDRLGPALAQEAALLDRFDDVLFASEAERASYEGAGLRPERARAWRWGFDPPGLPAAAAGEPLFDLGFIGGANAFNLEALAFLARAVLPRLEARLGRSPTALLAGGSAAAMRALFEDRGGVEVVPWAESLPAFYGRVGIIAVPLLSGTGVSIKTIEAARFGAAIVSTTTGARGLALRPGADFAVADDADGFASALAHLLTDPDRRRAIGAGAEVSGRRWHSQAAFGAAVGRLLVPTSPTSPAGC